MVVACELGGGAAMATAALALLWLVKERPREGERARVSEHGGFTTLSSP